MIREIRPSRALRSSALALAALLAVALPALPSPAAAQGDAQTPAAAAAAEASPPYVVGPPLTEPPELCPSGGRISLTLTVTESEVPVEVLDTDNTVRTQDLTLRNWQLAPGGTFEVCKGSDPPPTGEALIPGLTFRLRKSAKGTTDGTRFDLLLENELPVLALSPHECIPVHNVPKSGQVSIKPDRVCDATAFPAVPTEYPECFHGDNTTNFHYHGFHVSPQSPQDWVLLELQPKGSSCDPEDSNCRVGEFQFRLDPIPDNQAEGTHWYHPHKHGSTALQVLNGMSGTFLIEGEFDDWLQGFYQGKLDDKVLVVQQIHDSGNFFHESDTTFTKGCLVETTNEDGTKQTQIDRGDCSTCPDACVCESDNLYAPPQPAVNGAVNPVITMKSGEVQRWRFIGATMQASAQLEIGFPQESGGQGGFQIRQIAQDGVQFAPANYGKQPLLEEDEANELVETNLDLAPGNRLDLLVKAPVVATDRTFFVTHEVFGQLDAALDDLVDERRRAIARRVKARVEGETALQTPPLLSVKVLAQKQEMPLPTEEQWPEMPWFLQDIDETDGPARTVPFQLRGKAAQATNSFYIDDVQYCPTCAQYTATRGTAEEWTVVNTYDANPNGAAPQHPFHIHINPFQLRSKEYWVLIDDCETDDPQCRKAANKDKCLTQPKQCTVTYEPPIWMDTVALPAAITLPDKTTVKDAQVVFRQRYEDFTGEYVLHCHFLGHEDRGMMVNVQTVCDGKDLDLFGTTVPGEPDDCAVTSDAAARCSGECVLAGH